ncbi:hypothetical protein M902_1825 [Bacteriovorax sp. BAL6_X]|uniref:hypothetical protein n=1 Tax=Bacteriovorax sp. BAL6_X TaxID=1201290 RepID=UPI000386C88A|nr:hypothetical protein [Bacteriovorax sp. BAL6_X]EPZ51872.1 hypothetical protein M902_1825 [Bacteriovorax sp. BAL6_X]
MKSESISIQKKYLGCKKSTTWVKGSFNIKKKMHSAKYPVGLLEMQSLAQEKSLPRPVSDKIEFYSGFGSRNKKLVGLYDSPYMVSVAESFGYPIRRKLPKRIISKSKTGFATLLLASTLGDYARVQSVANGVEFSKYLFNDTGKSTLYGTRNAFNDERLYSLQHHVLKEIKKKIYHEVRMAEFFYKKGFERFLHRLKRSYRYIHRWTHLEYFWVFRTEDYIRDYRLLGETIYDLFGEFIAKIDNEGEIQDAIKYEFLDEDRRGMFLKAYRLTQDLIKIEVQFTRDFFGTNSRDYRYDDELLSDVFSKLERVATDIVSKVLSQLGNECVSHLCYEKALEKFISISPKYSKMILSMFKVGNGYLRVTSTENKNLYNALRKLVRANIVFKLKKSRYRISNDYEILLKEGRW